MTRTLRLNIPWIGCLICIYLLTAGSSCNNNTPEVVTSGELLIKTTEVVNSSFIGSATGPGRMILRIATGRN